MIGPGKYDDETTLVRERTKAQAVFNVVAIFGAFLLLGWREAGGIALLLLAFKQRD